MIAGMSKVEFGPDGIKVVKEYHPEGNEELQKLKEEDAEKYNRHPMVKTKISKEYGVREFGDTGEDCLYVADVYVDSDKLKEYMEGRKPKEEKRDTELISHTTYEGLKKQSPERDEAIRDLTVETFTPKRSDWLEMLGAGADALEESGRPIGVDGYSAMVWETLENYTGFPEDLEDFYESWAIPEDVASRSVTLLREIKQFLDQFDDESRQIAIDALKDIF